jgi:hypothetical protein
MFYRDATASVAAEADALEAARLAEIDALSADVVRLYARRRARIAFGIGAAVGWAAMVVAMITDAASATSLLLAAWVLALGSAGVALLVASTVLRNRLVRSIAGGGDPYQRAGALRGVRVAEIARRVAVGRRHASQAWPLIAANLLLPQTLHFLVYVVCAGSAVRIDDFDHWLAFTTALTPHVFAYGLYAAWTFPRTRRIGRHVGVAAVLSLIPGLLLVGIPSLVVLVTSGAVALLAYLPMDAVIDGDDVAELTIHNA